MAIIQKADGSWWDESTGAQIVGHANLQAAINQARHNQPGGYGAGPGTRQATATEDTDGVTATAAAGAITTAFGTGAAQVGAGFAGEGRAEEEARLRNALTQAGVVHDHITDINALRTLVTSRGIVAASRRGLGGDFEAGGAFVGVNPEDVFSGAFGREDFNPTTTPTTTPTTIPATTAPGGPVQRLDETLV